MEQFFLTCLQAQLIINRVNSHLDFSSTEKNEIIWEIKQVTKKGCFIDAKAD